MIGVGRALPHKGLSALHPGKMSKASRSELRGRKKALIRFIGLGTQLGMKRWRPRVTSHRILFSTSGLRKLFNIAHTTLWGNGASEGEPVGSKSPAPGATTARRSFELKRRDHTIADTVWLKTPSTGPCLFLMGTVRFAGFGWSIGSGSPAIACSTCLSRKFASAFPKYRIKISRQRSGWSCPMAKCAVGHTLLSACSI
jgi:hypothetical protein